jgi:hypothetical protein
VQPSKNGPEHAPSTVDPLREPWNLSSLDHDTPGNWGIFG